jgi:hypothetical protein
VPEGIDDRLQAEFREGAPRVSISAGPVRCVIRKATERELPCTGAVWHGHATWSLGDAPGRSPVCLVKGYPSYLTFSFWKGQAIDDPSGRLEATGAQQMAGVKLRSVDDLDAELFTRWLRQAGALERTA